MLMFGLQNWTEEFKKLTERLCIDARNLIPGNSRRIQAVIKLFLKTFWVGIESRVMVTNPNTVSKQ